MGHSCPECREIHSLSARCCNKEVIQSKLCIRECFIIIILTKRSQFSPQGGMNCMCDRRLNVQSKRSNMTSFPSDVLTKGTPAIKLLRTMRTLQQTFNSMLLIVDCLRTTKHCMCACEVSMKVSHIRRCGACRSTGELEYRASRKQSITWRDAATEELE